MLKKLLSLGIILTLASCSTPKLPDEAAVATPDISTQPFTQPVIEIETRLEQLQTQRLAAAARQDWPSYILYTEELWLQSSDNNRILIEQDSWLQLQAVDIATQETLTQHPHPQVKAWGWLLETRQLPGLHFKRALEDLTQITTDLSFNHYLIPQLIAYYDQSLDQGQTIAVLLPFSERLRAVSEQIRAGLLKAYWQSSQKDTLLFYDTEDASNIINLYLSAKQAGADIVIGPLTRTSIEALAELNPTDVIALNDIDQTTEFLQFNYRNAHEIQQLINHLEQEGYQHIAMLTSDAAADTRMAQQIQANWVQSHPFAINHHTYTQRNLRSEMAKVINADQSQSRAGHLSRTLGKPIEFFARTRQDLEAMILIGDDKQIAVLQPQLDYYLVKLPLYGTSLLTPEKLHQSPPNRDLKNIRFPTLAAALTESPLQNGLEAFGWDSYLLASHRHLLTPGLFINGAMGQHSITANQKVFTRLTWGQYQSNGQLAPLDASKYSPPYFATQVEALGQTLSDEEIEAIRLELLQDITQPHFPEPTRDHETSE